MKKEECLPENLEKGKVYDFLKAGAEDILAERR